ncbi:putative protein N(5)-glutamine methyltransferase [Paenarthrobacter histidinolovorans]|uniref:putative protein N(5)-glutamine methyltransferase n=1 Tax=Paenarthrobacter histidinolovorans TaxID=43664 RepID=UPI00166DB367|nr:putative protein N(5)-glutamine methyltransferase [Paenarthrobacter histidinolovorans]
MTLVIRSTTIVTALRDAGCVFAEDEARLLMDAAQHPDELDRMVDLRVAGLPLEHILGWVDFCGTRMAVDRGVFVPRRRTEFLVRQAVPAARRPADGRRPVVVDLCCGSGAIGAALNDVLGGCELHAADIDPAAVACARRNVEPRGGTAYLGDLFDPLPRRLLGRVDVLLVNAPYVPSESISLMPPEARLHEPAVALDGGADGLDVQRRVALGAPGWLAPGGRILIETSRQQTGETAALLRASGLMADVVTDEDLEATLVIGSQRGTIHHS